MTKSFAFMRLLQPSNSKTELRGREPHFTVGKREGEKNERRRREAKAS